MKFLLKYLPILDWLVGMATIGYGLVVGPLWLVPVGVLGLVVAWTKPAERVQAFLKSRLTAKNGRVDDTIHVQEAETFYAAMLEGSPSPTPVPSVEMRFERDVRFGPLSFGSSKHNLAHPGLLNLYQAPDPNHPPR